MRLAKCCAVAVLAVAVGVLSASPADAIKLDLKKCKWKPAAGITNPDLGGYDEGDSKFFFYTNGTATGEVEIPEDGEYTIVVEAGCTEALKEFAALKLMVGEVVVAKEHKLTAEESKKYTLTAKLKKGKQPVVVEFLNDVYKENEYDRNLFLFGVSFEKK